MACATSRSASEYLHCSPPTYGTQTSETIGATVVFRAVPGLTAEWFQQTVKCHLARAAALGHDVPEMSYCPLELKNVQASVSSAGDGFAVRVTSNDPQTAQEILRRARGEQPLGVSKNPSQ